MFLFFVTRGAFNPFGGIAKRPKSPLVPCLANTSLSCCRPIPAFANFSFIPLETGRSWREITVLRITDRLEMSFFTSSTVRKLPYFTKFSPGITANKTSDKALQSPSASWASKSLAGYNTNSEDSNFGFLCLFVLTHLRADVSKYRPEVYKTEKSKILKKIHKVALGKLLT